MMKVDRDFIRDKKTGKSRRFSYKDVKYDYDEWADASEYLPADFDLLYMKTKSKIYNGWISGTKWDGLKIPQDEKVLFWKCHKGER